MATYFVNPVTGNDANDGLSTCFPVKTIVKAGQLLHANPSGPHTVRLMPTAHYPVGIFDNVNFKGTLASPITVIADSVVAIFDTGYDGNTTNIGIDSTVPNGTVTDTFKSNPSAAWVPCTDPEAPSDEYVSVHNYPSNNVERYMMGIFLASSTGLAGDKLMTYNRLQDLRGGINTDISQGPVQLTQNESDVVVLLADPRTAGGPLVGDPTHKHPWCYRGPGIWWDSNPSATDKRIHIRLASTHMNTPGVTDYVSTPTSTVGTDPRTIPLSIHGNACPTANSQGAYITFKNLVFQNGGITSCTVGKYGTDAGSGIYNTFDHCTFTGGRNVVIGETTKFLRYTHCVFNGALPSYCTRGDTKGDYHYLDSGGVDQGNGLYGYTNDILMITSPLEEDKEVDHCEFRNAHDAMQAAAIRPRIHHNLFENINDDVFWTGGVNVVDVQIYNNVFRKVLVPFSHNNRLPHTGDRYYFRNIIDMRMPVLATRFLPPDVIPGNGSNWSIENDLKTAPGGVGNIIMYQNTLVQGRTSNVNYNASFFGDMLAGKTRQYVNNINMTIGVDKSLHQIPNPTVGTRFSDGNMWCRRLTTAVTPMYKD